MFSLKRKKASNAVEEVIELAPVENAAERLDRALSEMCGDGGEDAARIDQAIKIIHADRVMFVQHSGMPQGSQPPCTYAEARASLMAMVARGGDRSVEAYKHLLAVAADNVIAEGRRFNDKDDVEKAFKQYKSQA